MLIDIPPEWLEEVRRVLALVCFSERPLMTDEISDAFAVQLGPDSKLDLDYRLEDYTDLSRMCPGFIELNTEPRPGKKIGQLTVKPSKHRSPTVKIVRLAHFSIQEYVESGRIRQHSAAAFSMHSAEVHAQLAQICLV